MNNPSLVHVHGGVTEDDVGVGLLVPATIADLLASEHRYAGPRNKITLKRAKAAGALSTRSQLRMIVAIPDAGITPLAGSAGRVQARCLSLSFLDYGHVKYGPAGDEVHRCWQSIKRSWLSALVECHGVGVLRSLFIVELKVLVLDGSLHSLWSHPGHLVFTKENNTLCKYRGRRDTMGLSDIYQKTEDRRRWKGGPTLLVPLVTGPCTTTSVLENTHRV